MKTKSKEVAMGCGAATGKTEEFISNLKAYIVSLTSFAEFLSRTFSLIESLVDREWDPALLTDDVAEAEVDWRLFESRFYSVTGMLYDVSKTEHYRFALENVQQLGLMWTKLREERTDAFQSAMHYVSDKCQYCTRNEFSDKARELISLRTRRDGHSSCVAVR